MNKHTGGCLCGSVRFELNKEPDFAYGCHCRFCQKATGTAFRSGLRCQKSSVKFNDGEVKTYGVGDVIHIPVKSKHQAKNIGDDDLVFIEVQLGEYFGEDDIVRLEDKYGRV